MNLTFDEALQALQSHRQTVTNELQACDKALVDYDHLFELAALPDDALTKIHEDYVKTLRKRRQCKNRIALLQSIDYKLNQQKHYNPRILFDDFRQYERYIK